MFLVSVVGGFETRSRGPEGELIRVLQALGLSADVALCDSGEVGSIALGSAVWYWFSYVQSVFGAFCLVGSAPILLAGQSLHLSIILSSALADLLRGIHRRESARAVLLF